MKFLKRALSLLLCAAACTAAFAGCNAGKSEAPGTQNPAQTLGGITGAVAQGAHEFAAKFASAALQGSDAGKNYAVSPVSAYMALSVAAACTSGQTREEIVSALGVDYQTLESGFSEFYGSVVKDRKDDLGEQAGLVTPVNSVWLNDGTAFKQDCLQTLADNYHCYSRAADFFGDNENANLAVRNFVKEQTRGLIDSDFQLSTETLLVILNTLYLKDVWNSMGDELPLTREYTFANADGTTTKKQLLQGHYRAGRVHKAQKYSLFCTGTNLGLKIKFILPAKGYALDAIFTEDVLAEANAFRGYQTVNEKKKEEYYTRCLFPEYLASYDGDIMGILKTDFGIERVFQELSADFSPVTDERMFCTQVRHIAKLDVNRKGVEGAAVTMLGMGATGIPEEKYKKVYEDFVVDRSFGFLLTDGDDTVLFSGMVNKI